VKLFEPEWRKVWRPSIEYDLDIFVIYEVHEVVAPNNYFGTVGPYAYVAGRREGKPRLLNFTVGPNHYPFAGAP